MHNLQIPASKIGHLFYVNNFFYWYHRKVHIILFLNSALTAHIFFSCHYTFTILEYNGKLDVYDIEFPALIKQSIPEEKTQSTRQAASLCKLKWTIPAQWNLFCQKSTAQSHYWFTYLCWISANLKKSKVKNHQASENAIIATK